MDLWAFSFSDDVRLQIFEHLWPKEWLLTCHKVCRAARHFFSRQDVRESLIMALSEDAFALTSPLWRLLRSAIAADSPCSTSMLKPAFLVMGKPAARTTSCRGGRSRLLGRCFTVSAQMGHVRLVTLALQCRADIEQRINGQSALDSAAQAGQVAIAEVLLQARAAAAQTAQGRWTPLMRAAQGGHVRVCELLLTAGVDPDEWADRTTALDVAVSLCHHGVVKALEAKRARRFLELPPDRRRSEASKSTRITLMSKQRPPRRASGRGVLWGSASLLLQPRVRIPAADEAESDEEEDAEACIHHPRSGVWLHLLQLGARVDGECLRRQGVAPSRSADSAPSAEVLQQRALTLGGLLAPSSAAQVASLRRPYVARRPCVRALAEGVGMSWVQEHKNRDVDGVGTLALSNAAKAVALANSMAEMQAASKHLAFQPQMASEQADDVERRLCRLVVRSRTPQHGEEPEDFSKGGLFVPTSSPEAEGSAKKTTPTSLARTVLGHWMRYTVPDLRQAARAAARAASSGQKAVATASSTPGRQKPPFLVAMGPPSIALGVKSLAFVCADVQKDHLVRGLRRHKSARGL
ncbi:Ankrd17 [Symbiodinium natans]|uniref:Ankrd17 protein n=1 Tax=Symbiodinium natans TaxID=878477 RepID=A0A812JLR4_9DINO|nr:Ankrd17 [Symbiodinium natans]